MGRRTEFSSIKEGDLKCLKNVGLFQDLKNHILNIYEVATLHNFFGSKKQLSTYSETLKMMLSRDLQNVTVDLSLLECLPFAPSTLNVVIKDGDKLKYRAVLLTLTNSARTSRTRFQLMCVIKSSGTSFTKKIHELFEKLFFWDIKHYTLGTEEFKWILGITVNETLRRRMNDAVTISFGFPSFLQSAQIHVYLSEDVLQGLWETCLFNTENKVSLKSLEKFCNGIYEHLFFTYDLNFTYCNIKQIILEGVRINCGEKLQLKISSSEILYVVLTYMHNLMFERREA